MTRVIRARAARAVLVAVGVLGMLAACAAPAPPSPDAWRLTALRHDNATDGGDVEQLTDVTFPMVLAPDGAGGVWGTSAGSWLHLDAAGDTVRRFNLPDGSAPTEVHGMAALSPEVLVVSGAAPGASGAVHLVDTGSGTWRVLHGTGNPLGDVATHDGAVYVVVFATGDSEFTVRRLDPADPDAAVDVAVLPFPPVITSSLVGTVALDVGPDGALYVATQAERIVVAADGEVLARAADRVARPRVAVGPAGDVVWAAAGVAETPPVHFSGSDEARRAYAACADDHVVVGAGTAADGVALPLGCVQGLAWVAPDTFVASVGGEGGAPLVRVEPPTG